MWKDLIDITRQMSGNIIDLVTVLFEWGNEHREIYDDETVKARIYSLKEHNEQLVNITQVAERMTYNMSKYVVSQSPESY